MNCAGAKLLSLTRTSVRRPSARSGPKVMPSTLSSGMPSASRSSSSALLHRLDRAELAGEARAAADVLGAGEVGGEELDRVPRAGRADRERPLHGEERVLVEREQLDEPVHREVRRGHRRLGDRIRPVEVLPVGPAGLEVVAQQPRRAGHAERRGRAVLDERALGARVEVRPDDGAALEAEVLAHAARLRAPGGDERLRHRQVGRAAARPGRRGAPTAGSAAWRSPPR